MRLVSSLLFAFVVAVALALATGEARAQTTTPAGPSVTGVLGAVQRFEPGSNTNADNADQHPHPNGVLANKINYEDCVADLEYQFDLGIAYPNNSYNLEVWAGSQDCTQLTNRQTSANAVCWPAAGYQHAEQNPSIVRVRMRDIVAQAFTTTHQTTYAPAPTIAAGAAGVDAVCRGQTQTGPSNISLYFFFVDSQSQAVGTAQPYPISIDILAGDVQGPVAVGVGDTLLIVNIPSTTDTDTQGWNVYCDPPPGQESAVQTVPLDAPSNNGTCPAQIPDSSGADTAAVDGSPEASVLEAAAPADSAPPPPVLDDAGGNACGVRLNEAGIPAPGGCSVSSVLVSGGGSTTTNTTTTTVDEAGNVVVEDAGTFTATPAGEGGTVSITGGKMKLLPSKYLCASGSVSATSLNVLGLKNGVYYNIAVAAVDGVGNVGPLSNVPCGEPVPVDDFWKLYRGEGGRAGGGFCSADGIGVPAGSSGLGVLMVASMVALIRKRRRS